MWTYVKAGAAIAVVVAMAWLWSSRASALVDAATVKTQFSEYRTEVSNRALRQMEDNNRDAMVRARNNERIADAQFKRDQAVQERIAAAQRAAGSLRDTIRDLERRPVPEDPRTRAYAHEASVARGALEQCSERYRWVDGEAKKLGSQVIGLQSFVVDVCKAGSLEERAPLPAEGQHGAAPDEAGL